MCPACEPIECTTGPPGRSRLGDGGGGHVVHPWTRAARTGKLGNEGGGRIRNLSDYHLVQEFLLSNQE